MHADFSCCKVHTGSHQGALQETGETAQHATCSYIATMYHCMLQGLELAEPPLPYAAAAASAVADSIKALTGDDSVLVGVSLIRLGVHGTTATNVSAAAGAEGDSAAAVHIARGLDGNLCRCTGWRPILDACRVSRAQQHPLCTSAVG